MRIAFSAVDIKRRPQLLSHLFNEFGASFRIPLVPKLCHSLPLISSYSMLNAYLTNGPILNKIALSLR